jgi:hypothetical protein
MEVTKFKKINKFLNVFCNPLTPKREKGKMNKGKINRFSAPSGSGKHYRQTFIKQEDLNLEFQFQQLLVILEARSSGKDFIVYQGTKQHIKTRIFWNGKSIQRLYGTLKVK